MELRTPVILRAGVAELESVINRLARVLCPLAGMLHSQPLEMLQRSLMQFAKDRLLPQQASHRVDHVGMELSGLSTVKRDPAPLGRVVLQPREQALYVQRRLRGRQNAR